MKEDTIRTRWNVVFAETDNEGYDIRRIDMTWEKQSTASVLENLNIFLRAVAPTLSVVEKRKQ